jgi:two-component system cell cycle sensor histidine kinase/response regulator CckA
MGRESHRVQGAAEGLPGRPVAAGGARMIDRDGDGAKEPRAVGPRQAGLGSTVGYYDREGRFLYATPAMAAYFGMTPDQLIGRTWYEIGVPPENVTVLESARRKVLITGQPTHEKASIQIAGTLRVTDFLIKPTLGPDGSIVGTVVTAWADGDKPPSSPGAARLDRTYRILSAVDQVILRSKDPTVILEEACRIAAGIGGFELAWVGLLDSATGDVRLAYSAGRDEGLLRTITVTARDEVSGHGVVGTCIRENRTAIVQDVRRDPRMSYWREFFERLGCRTAAGFPLRVSGSPIGALALYSARSSHFDAVEARLFEQVAQDISNALTSIDGERAIAEAQVALAASERRYRDLFNLSPHPMAVVDTESLCLLGVNDAAVADYGYTREEFLAMTILDLLVPEDAQAVLAALERNVGTGVFRTTGPWRQILRDGSVIKVEVSAHDIEIDGRPARLMLAIDVTERERMQAQLAEAARLEAMGHLAGGIAHDFNNLLTAVNGYSDVLIEELGDDPRAESAREIRRAGARATELTRQVMAFARRQEAAPRPVDVNAVVANVTQMLRRLIGEQITLEIRSSARPAVARVDPGQLEQVLVNLAVNARDAMPDGGALGVAVEEVTDARSLDRDLDGPAILLTVADNGVGMDEATLARAFEPFFTTKEVGQGTGFGLATAYGIIRQADGRLWAESAVGRGTRVCVLLPRLDAEPEPLPSPSTSVRPPARRAVILAVEDDPTVRTFIVSTLERSGYRVLVAGTPAEAVALSEGLSERIDLLLSDVVMPGQTGHDLAGRLLAGRPELRVLLISGYDVRHAAPAKASLEFLAKPLDPSRLLAAVERALAGHG